MMKLITTATSPYGRKIRILLKLLDLQENQDYEIQSIIPHPRPEELTQYNVLSRVPTLVLVDGTVIVDSQLITDYLLSHYTNSSTNSLISTLLPKEQEWSLKNLTQIAHGIIEYTINIVMENQRPEKWQSQEWTELMTKDIDRILNFLEAKHVPNAKEPINLYSLTLICALDFIDFRLPNFGWQKDYPKLAIWQKTVNQLDPIKETYPS